MLQGFIRFPEFVEFTEFPFLLGKTPIFKIPVLALTWIGIPMYIQQATQWLTHHNGIITCKS